MTHIHIHLSAEAKRRFDAHWEDPAALPSEYKVKKISI
jgi:hypothetical protein